VGEAVPDSQSSGRASVQCHIFKLVNEKTAAEGNHEWRTSGKNGKGEEAGGRYALSQAATVTYLWNCTAVFLTAVQLGLIVSKAIP
jgi:hypothetical protein